MKNIQKISFLLMLIFLTAAGCKKDPIMYSKGIESFTLVEKNAAGVVLKEYPGSITNDEILVSLPIEVDVTKLTVDFKTENPRTIVQVGNEVQEPGLTEQDFSHPLAFRIKAEDKSTRTYQVRVEKKIALESFGFYKADNPKLSQDYIAVIRGLKIDIAVHETVDISKLVARFQTTAGVTLKVGALIQESKKTSNDYSNTVIYSFTDGSMTTPLQFTTVLSFIGPQWWMIGDKTIITTGTSNLKMAINPITKYPYIVYYRTGKDATGTTIATDQRKAVVLGYTGTNWNYIGPAAGISNTQVDDTHISFNQEGTPYISYKDYKNSEQKATVLKYVNNEWSAVGIENASPMRTDKYSFTIGEFDEPVVAVSTFTAITGYLKRAIYTMNYKNGAWVNTTPAITNPLIGGVKVFRGLDGKTYMAVLDRSNNLSMYMFKNSAWVAVGPTSFRASDGLSPYTSVIGAASASGEVYIAYQTVVSSERKNRVLRFNGSTWEELGSAGSSEGETDKYALAIDPTGKLYFAYANNNSLIIKTFNEETKNWNAARSVVSGKISEFDLQVSADGIPYIAVTTSADSKTAIYKFTTTK